MTLTEGLNILKRSVNAVAWQAQGIESTARRGKWRPDVSAPEAPQHGEDVTGMRSAEDGADNGEAGTKLVIEVEQPTVLVQPRRISEVAAEAQTKRGARVRELFTVDVGDPRLRK